MRIRNTRTHVLGKRSRVVFLICQVFYIIALFWYCSLDGYVCDWFYSSVRCRFLSCIRWLRFKKEYRLCMYGYCYNPLIVEDPLLVVYPHYWPFTPVTVQRYFIINVRTLSFCWSVYYYLSIFLFLSFFCCVFQFHFFSIFAKSHS